MNGTLGIDIWTVLSPIDVMVGIAFSSGGKNSKMRTFSDSPTFDTRTFIASSQLSLLLISKTNPERPWIRCCTKVMHQKGPHVKYAAMESINAALSTYAPTARAMTPPPNQRAAFQVKEENFDNGYLNAPNYGYDQIALRTENVYMDIRSPQHLKKNMSL